MNDSKITALVQDKASPCFYCGSVECAFCGLEVKRALDYAVLLMQQNVDFLGADSPKGKCYAACIRLVKGQFPAMEGIVDEG